jgi:N-acetylglutamate synthase-like GNAT family acetyltransferase
MELLSTVPEFDPGIANYPTSRMLVACNGHGIAYLPTQKVLVLESLAIRPDTDRLTSAQATRDLVKGAELLASSEGIKEIMFLATDKTVAEMAKRQGFQELPWPVLRLKL